MTDTTTLDALFDLLHEMILDRRKDGEVKNLTALHRLEVITGGGYAIATLIFVAVLVTNLWFSSTLLDVMRIFSTAATIVFGIACLLFMLLHLAWQFRQACKYRFDNLLALLRTDLHADAGYLARFAAYDKATLEYALLQYRHRWDVVDGRLNLLIGDLRKLGVLPAFVASAVAASMLIRNDSSLWLWLPLCILATQHVLLFPLYLHRERPQQVVELLRYAIDHAAAPPAAATKDAAVATTQPTLPAVSPAPPPAAAATRTATMPSTA